MTIGLVLAATPNYSETFFINKIKGLQSNGFKVILFVRETRKDFNLCTVRKMPKVYDNKLQLLFQSLFTALSLLPHLRKVIRFYRLEKNLGSTTTEILKRIYLNSHILSANLDWIHFGFATQTIGSELVAKAIRSKMAVSFRGYDINVYPKKFKNCYHRLWSHVDKVHSISKYLLEEAYKLGLKKNVPFSIITPAIDVETFEKLNTLHSSSNNDIVKICTVARFTWIKDITKALECIKFLKNAYPNIRYNIIGDGTIKETERYKYLVSLMDLKENVKFHKRLNHQNTLKLIKDCDIYLQTSINEGFCNAVLEAQALGKLTVVSDVGGLRENVIHNTTGWLVNPVTVEAFASKITEILNWSETDKNSIFKAAQNRVKEKFTSKIQIQKFVDFYMN